MLDVPIVEPRYEALPVFPMPSFVLFPNTMTRLHIFEPRYRMMTAEALAGSRMIVLVGLKPGWEADYYGSPPTFEVGSLCKIVNEERMEDGRYNLFVHCLARVQITHVNRLMPYRVAGVSVLPDRETPLSEIDTAMGRVLGVVRSLVVKLGDKGTALAEVLGSTRKSVLLSNRLASALCSDPVERQRLLENTDPLERLDKIGDLAGDLLVRVDHPEIDFDKVDWSVIN
jgi:Lon protease-like protein